MNSNEVWNEYLDGLKPIWEGLRNENFEKSKCVWSRLPNVDDLKTAIAQAPVEAFERKANTQFSVEAAKKDEVIERLKEGNTFVALDAATRWALFPILKHLQGPVASVLGCKWRVLNCRAWIASHGASGGPYEWHSDGMPEQMLKLMIYCNEMGGDYGGLEVDTGDGTTKEISGPAGTWVLFYNSVLMHRGIPPRKPGLKRVVMEITLAPWVRFVVIPRSLGVNGKHPAFPLMNDLEGL